MIESTVSSSGAVVSSVIMYIIARLLPGETRDQRCIINWSVPSQALVGSKDQCLMYTNQFLSSKGSLSG